MPNKLTDAEVKKALEYCSQQGVTSECERCKVKGCRSELIKLALDLINRQEDKCKAYKHYYDECLKDLKNANAENENLKAEVKRLQNAYKQCAWERDIFAEDMKEEIKKDCSYLMLDIKTIKAEAYKEFAEEYKDQIKNYTGIFTDDGFMVNLEAVLSAVDFIKNKLVDDGND